MFEKDFLLYALEGSTTLGEEIAKKLKVELSPLIHTKFADGEELLKSEVTVRGKDVFIVSSTASPVGETIMRLLIFVDSLKRASAKTITVVMPYYGYARQDRKAKGREPITAKLVADLLQVAGVTKVIAMDLHNPSIQGFFNIPVDDLKGEYTLAAYINKMAKKDDIVVVSPDHGGAVRARILSDLLNTENEVAIVDKRRTGPNQAEVMGVLGDVKDKTAIIVDDMIDTGGTIIKAAQAIREQGAKRIIVTATHGLFSKGFEAFEKADDIECILITNSIEKIYTLSKSEKLKIVSVADFMAEAIKATFYGYSITDVYKTFKAKVK